MSFFFFKFKNMFWIIEKIEEKKIPVPSKPKSFNSSINFEDNLYLGYILFTYISNFYTGVHTYFEEKEDRFIYYDEEDIITLHKSKKGYTFFDKIEITNNNLDITKYYHTKKMLIISNFFMMESHLLNILLKSCGIDIVGIEKTKEGIYFSTKSQFPIFLCYKTFDFLPFFTEEVYKKIENICSGK